MFLHFKLMEELLVLQLEEGDDLLAVGQFVGESVDYWCTGVECGGVLVVYLGGVGLWLLLELLLLGLDYTQGFLVILSDWLFYEFVGVWVD